ncbi:MAG: hypothetical protein JWM92_84 [Candidatus Nomurabacteria bacterium]|nr:hypothetical protein [Candidatus Nomurabacteria bacterium]
MKNTTTMWILAIVLVIAAFLGGKAYGAKQTASTQQAALTSRTGRAGGFGARAGGGATLGQVVAKDATSVAVSIPTGGSRIILYSPSTTISKSATGNVNDITTGATISATGTTNPDGSITATSIQIRPAGSMPAAPAAPTGQ